MSPGFLIEVVVVLVIVGLLLWLLSQFPIDPTMHRIIRAVVIVFVVLWLVYTFLGQFSGGFHLHSLRRSP
jgi:hypothetical protein